MTATGDPDADRYLRRLERAARGVPGRARWELLADIEAHLSEVIERSPGNPAAVHAALDALGPPDAVAAAAGARPGRPSTRDVATIVLLLVGGILPFPILGWLAGVVLLWSSPSWSTRHRVAATLVWPLGLVAPVLLLISAPFMSSESTVCSGSASTTPTGGTTSPMRCVTSGHGNLPEWLAVTVAVVVLAAPVVVAVWLYRSAARSERADVETAAPVTVW